MNAKFFTLTNLASLDLDGLKEITSSELLRRYALRAIGKAAIVLTLTEAEATFFAENLDALANEAIKKSQPLHRKGQKTTYVISSEVVLAAQEVK